MTLVKIQCNKTQKMFAKSCELNDASFVFVSAVIASRTSDPGSTPKVAKAQKVFANTRGQGGGLRWVPKKDPKELNPQAGTTVPAAKEMAGGEHNDLFDQSFVLPEGYEQ